MSHVAEIDLELKDLDAVGRAADALGMRLVRDAKTFTYYAGQQSPCVHKLVFKDAQPGAWEVGLVYADNSLTSYRPALDDFGMQGKRITDALGRDCVELKKRYTAEVSAAQLRKQGYRVQIKQDAGQYRIRGTK